MWVMATLTMVPLATALGEIPVTFHTTMRPMLVIAVLWSVTLRTELNAIFESYSSAICQT